LLRLFQNYNSNSSSAVSSVRSNSNYTPVQQQSSRATTGAATSIISATSHSSSTTLTSTSSGNLIELIFRSIDRHNSGRISVEDAEKILLRLNSRLGRRYGEDDVTARILQ
jgi:hypothetical protein